MLAKLTQQLRQRKRHRCNAASGIGWTSGVSVVMHGRTCRRRRSMFTGIQVVFAATRHLNQEHLMTAKRPGLYANIQAKKNALPAAVASI
jgi:hypothetical protein